MEYLYIGVDVGKHFLDIFYLNKNIQIKNDSSEIKSFIKSLKKADNYLFVCEATGGYEQEFIHILKEKNLSFNIVHPNKVRAFAKSKGILGKTDKLDSKLIFEYAVLFKTEAQQQFKTQSEETLGILLKRREQLQSDKFREQNRLDKKLPEVVIKSIENHIEWINTELKNIEKELTKLTRTDKNISDKIALLSSVPSIGKIVSSYLICFLPELGKLTDREASSLVGVAPFNRDSGNFSGKRYIRGGRSNIRKVLYLSAVVSTRCCEDMKVFYQRLKTKGKSTKVALIAVMRKLVIILNSIMKRRTGWVEKSPQNTA